MKGWKTVSLGDAADFIRGITFKPGDVVPVGHPGSVACMRTKNVQATLDCSDVWGVGERFVKTGDQYLEAGDILVSSANSWNLVGKCCWIPELPWRATFGGFVSVLRPRRTVVNPRFLFRWFSSDRVQAVVRSFGQQTTNISNLNTGRCLKLAFPLPPLPDQRRIADLLDRAEALRAKRRSALAQLDTLIQSTFLELFGAPSIRQTTWPVSLLGDACEKITDGTHHSPPIQPTGIPYITAKHVKDHGLDFDADPWFVSEEDHRQIFARCDPKPGDVLYIKDGATTGIAAVNQYNFEFSMLSSVALLRPSPRRLESTYLCHWLNNPMVKRELLGEMAGVAIRRLTLTKIKAVRIPTPPLGQQRQFTGRVAAIEKLKVTHRASLTELDALFASLQHRAFRGEL